MVFSGILFLYCFLPAVLILYYLVPGKYKNAVLLFASLFFYAWGEQLLVLLFSGVIILSWGSALLIERSVGTAKKKILYILTLIINLGLLCWFKYADFFIENMNRLFGFSLFLPQVSLPVGISFYTFQLLSYTTDVYRGNVRAQRNPIDFAAYVAMFPQLVAGPIVRYADIEGKLKIRTHDLPRIADGIRRFIRGLGKKVLIANILSEIGAAFKVSADPSVLFYWLYAVSYFFQVYFDFSGYSDMAIGLGKLFGFDFPENFDYPYTASSITEFWRRWHITLGSWFRDYVYIPLGGNRKGLKRQLIHILIVWMLTGLWHGAAWNFVFWGLYFAVLLAIEKLWTGKWLEKHRGLGHIYVLITVLLSFVLFDSSTLFESVQTIRGLFGLLPDLPAFSAEALYFLRSYAVILMTAGLFSTPLLKNIVLRVRHANAGRRVLLLLEPVVLMLILLFSTAWLVDGSFNPFLYFRF